MPEWAIPAGVGGGLVVVIAAMMAAWRRRRRRAREAEEAFESERPALVPLAQQDTPVAAPPEPVAAQPPAPAMFTPPPAPRAPLSRATLEIELAPRRAGINLLTATADVEVIVRNIGEAEAENVRIDVRLTSVRQGQEAELAEVFADTSARPAAAPFSLAPGAVRSVRALVTLPRSAVNLLHAAGRPMFVPLLTINALYWSGEGEGQAAQGYALGEVREGSDKLAPFWLDVPARMYEAVDARAHGPAFVR